MEMQLILLLRAIGLAAQASGIDNAATVNRYARIASNIISGGSEVESKLAALTEQLERMVAENRDPTDQEWATLQGKITSNGAILDAWEDPEDV